MNNIHYGIIKFIEKNEEDYSPSFNCPIYKIYLNSYLTIDEPNRFIEKNSFSASLLNKYLNLAFKNLSLDNIIIIREGISISSESILNLIFLFEKYPRLGISFPQIYEEYEGFPNEYYSTFELNYNS